MTAGLAPRLHPQGPPPVHPLGKRERNNNGGRQLCPYLNQGSTPSYVAGAYCHPVFHQGPSVDAWIFCLNPFVLRDSIPRSGDASEPSKMRLMLYSQTKLNKNCCESSEKRERKKSPFAVAKITFLGVRVRFGENPHAKPCGETQSRRTEGEKMKLKATEMPGLFPLSMSSCCSQILSL